MAIRVRIHRWDQIVQDEIVQDEIVQDEIVQDEIVIAAGWASVFFIL